MKDSIGSLPALPTVRQSTDDGTEPGPVRRSMSSGSRPPALTPLARRSSQDGPSRGRSFDGLRLPRDLPAVVATTP